MSSNTDGKHDSTFALDRRSFIKGAAGVVGGALAASLVPGSVWAKSSHPALGTWPKGVQGSSVFLGLVCPLTGAYSATGADLKKGYELAIEHLNNGEGIGQNMQALKGTKGVLGKRIKYAIGDCETKPNVAVQLATRYIQSHNAMMISGGTASSTAIALEKLAQREKVVNMCGASGANATTGVDCQRYGFRSQVSAYMAGQALAPVLAKALGKDRKAVYLVPDYVYGHSVAKSTKEATEALGWKTVGTQVAPVGTSDFSSYLINIANSGADVFINVEFGNDSVASSKQAKQFGILKRMKMVVPNISPFQARSSGVEVMEGVYGTIPFWWTLANQNADAKIFVDAFYKKYKYKPRWCAHIGYMQLFLWADAVTRAGTYYPPAVIKEFEKEQSFTTGLGQVHYRAADHQLVRDVPVVVGKSKSEMEGPEDYFKIVGLVPGKDVVPPADKTGCKMPGYT